MKKRLKYQIKYMETSQEEFEKCWLFSVDELVFVESMSLFPKILVKIINPTKIKRNIAHQRLYHDFFFFVSAIRKYTKTTLKTFLFSLTIC